MTPNPSANGNPTLRAAKAAVMAECPYLQKIKTPGLSYSFASEADLIGKLRPSMLTHGLTLSPSGLKVITDAEYTTGKGTVMRRVLIKAKYTFTHVGSGEHEDCYALGEGADVGDKAANKAMTAALKYALRQFFLIETGNDPDETPSESRAQAPQRQAQPAQQQQAPPPAQTPAPQQQGQSNGFLAPQQRAFLTPLLQQSGIPAAELFGALGVHNLAATPDYLFEIVRLIAITRANPGEFAKFLGVKTLTKLDVTGLDRAVKALQRKKAEQQPQGS